MLKRCDNRIRKFVMRYSSEYLLSAERGFFRWRFLEVKVKGEGEQWKGFDNWIEMRREGEI